MYLAEIFQFLAENQNLFGFQALFCLDFVCMGWVLLWFVLFYKLVFKHEGSIKNLNFLCKAGTTWAEIILLKTPFSVFFLTKVLTSFSKYYYPHFINGKN